MKSVLVHECFDAAGAARVSFRDYGDRFARQVFVRTPNVTCSCRHRISYSEREAALSREDVIVMIPFDSEFPDWRHVVALRKKARTNAQTITFRNIEAANGIYGNGPAAYHSRRIELYGADTQTIFAELGAVLVCPLRLVVRA